MSQAGKKTGQKPKSAKAAKNEFEQVVRELKKESRHFQTPSSHKIIFGAAAAWTAFAPLYIYISGIFEVNVRESIIVFLLGPIVAAAILCYVYDVLASQSRYSSLINKDDAKKADAIVNQCLYYSIFAINTSYLAIFLGSVGYLLPLYQLSYPVSFSVASVFSAVSCASLVAAKLL